MKSIQVIGTVMRDKFRLYEQDFKTFVNIDTVMYYSLEGVETTNGCAAILSTCSNKDESPDISWVIKLVKSDEELDFTLSRVLKGIIDPSLNVVLTPIYLGEEHESDN